MTDPIRDLERRLDRLESKVDLADQSIRGDIRAMRSDIERIKADTLGFVPLIRYMPVERVVYGLVGLVLIAVTTSAIALVVRSS
jgi:hypothetical protein